MTILFLDPSLRDELSNSFRYHGFQIKKGRGMRRLKLIEDKLGREHSICYAFRLKTISP